MKKAGTHLFTSPSILIFLVVVLLASGNAQGAQPATSAASTALPSKKPPPPPPPRMKPGTWEATEVVTIGGMKMPATKYDTFCLKEGEAEAARVIPFDMTRPDCKHSKPTVRGNHVSWTQTCTDPKKPLSATGNITWQEETFTGTVVVKHLLPQMAKMGPVTARLNGKRTGDCK